MPDPTQEQGMRDAEQVVTAWMVGNSKNSELPCEEVDKLKRMVAHAVEFRERHLRTELVEAKDAFSLIFQAREERDRQARRNTYLEQELVEARAEVKKMQKQCIEVQQKYGPRLTQLTEALELVKRDHVCDTVPHPVDMPCTVCKWIDTALGR